LHYRWNSYLHDANAGDATAHDTLSAHVLTEETLLAYLIAELLKSKPFIEHTDYYYYNRASGENEADATLDGSTPEIRRISDKIYAFLNSSPHAQPSPQSSLPKDIISGVVSLTNNRNV
jgi:hypothetical protein